MPAKRIKMKSQEELMEKFGTFLKKAEKREKVVPFMLRWVVQALQEYLLSPGQKLTLTQKKQFLSKLSQKYEPWQVEQADLALKLYEYFLNTLSKESSELSYFLMRTALKILLGFLLGNKRNFYRMMRGNP